MRKLKLFTLFAAMLLATSMWATDPRGAVDGPKRTLDTYDVKLAEAVIVKINNIPQPVELKLATRDSIQNARAAYGALTAAQQDLVTNYQTLLNAEAALATLNPGGAAADALSGKFTINANGDQVSFAKGNLQATTTNNGSSWTWAFAKNQYDFIGNAAANNAINGNKSVSKNGTVDLFGWSTPTTYYGIHNSENSNSYSGNFRDWGENITGATWKTPSPDDWSYIISNRANAAQKQGQATVNGVNGYIFLPDEWELPTGLSFTAKPNNWTANVYDGDAWTAMENAGAVFLPISHYRQGNTVIPLSYGYYWSSDYNNYSNAMAYCFRNNLTITGTEMPRYVGIYVRLVTADVGSLTPLDSAQIVKDLIDAIPTSVTLDSKDEIDAARNAYDALSETTKGALDEATVQKMTDAEDAYDALEADHNAANVVINLINAIDDPVVYTDACHQEILDAREAYDNLTQAQKDLIDASTLQKLTNAEDAYASLNVDITAKLDPQNAGVYYSTFYDGSRQMQLPADVEAYTATVSGDKMLLKKVAVPGDILPAATAVVLRAPQEDVTLTPSAASPVSVENNALLGTDVNMEVPSDHCYVLSGADGFVGFYPLSAPYTLTAHKAYIDLDNLPGGANNAPRRLRFVFSEEQTATGMENVQHEETKAQKVMIDGVMYIIRGEHMYDAQGQIIK